MPLTAAPSSPSIRGAVHARGEAIAIDLAARAVFAVGSAAYAGVREFLADRRARRADKAELLEFLEDALVTAHMQDFEPATAPVWQEPESVNGHAVRCAFRRDALAPFSRWQLVRRRRAAAVARLEAERWIAAESQRRRDEEEARYARAAELWPGLVENRTEDVLAALEDAFDDNELPAFAVDCDGGVITIVMVSGDADSLPDKTVVRYDDGSFDFAAREDTATLHRDAVLSNALATAKEAFAAAPFIRAVQLVGVERRAGIVRKDKLVPLCLFRLLRSDLDALDWERPPMDIVRNLEAAVFDVASDDDRLLPIDLDDENEVRDVIREVADGLECRA